MFDAALRRRLDGPLAAAAERIDRSWVTPDRLTVAGLLVGLASAGLAASQLWGWALLAWLVSRALDGLDGPLARRRGTGEGSPAGGFLDITADFVVYGATVVGVAVGSVGASGVPRGVAPVPRRAAGLLRQRHRVPGVLLDRRAHRAPHRRRPVVELPRRDRRGDRDDRRALLWLLVPAYAPLVATVWAGVVGISAAHRVVVGYRTLRGPAAGGS